MDKISSSSTKEEIASFFTSKFKIAENIKENLLKEDISGDLLLNLSDDEFKKLGFKVGPLKKVKKFLKDNQSLFPEIKIDEKIGKPSTAEDVKTFFEKYIGYQGDVNMDGEQLLALKEDDMVKLGLNLGQRKKLEKYLKYFNSIKTTEKQEINQGEEKPKEDHKDDLDDAEKKTDLNKKDVEENKKDSGDEKPKKEDEEKPVEQKDDAVVENKEEKKDEKKEETENKKEEKMKRRKKMKQKKKKKMKTKAKSLKKKKRSQKKKKKKKKKKK